MTTHCTGCAKQSATIGRQRTRIEQLQKQVRKPLKKGVPVIYISGPMTGHEFLNRKAFAAAAARLRGMGYTVVNPAETDPPGAPSWEDCLRNDIRDMMDCSMLALLPGWETSKGANLEVYIAKALGWPCVPVAEVREPEIITA